MEVCPIKLEPVKTILTNGFKFYWGARLFFKPRNFDRLKFFLGYLTQVKLFQQTVFVMLFDLKLLHMY
jgi:hypothetical protein